MGAAESASIRVNFNRSNVFYYAGETVTGSISTTNLRNKINDHEAFIEFIGELTSPTPSTRLSQEEHGRARKENYIEPNRVIFWSAQVAIMRPTQNKVRERSDRGLFIISLCSGLSYVLRYVL